MNYSESRSIEEICENSSKLITLIDLAGHHKYMKTTIFGLTCYSPDFTMLVVSANTGMGEYNKGPDKECLCTQNWIYFLTNQIKHVFRVLKRTVSLRQFF